MKFNNKILSIGLVICVSAFSISLANAAVINVYTDRTLWESALSGATIVTETFDNNIAVADVITLDNGIVSTANPSGVTTNPFYNQDVLSGVYSAYTSPNPTLSPESYTWALPESIYAFGGDFEELNFSQTEVNITALGYSDLLADAIGSSNGFYGLISDVPFSSLVFINDNTGGDYWELDNFSSVTTSVPEPATLALMGIGLAGLGFSRKRKAA